MIDLIDSLLRAVMQSNYVCGALVGIVDRLDLNTVILFEVEHCLYFREFLRLSLNYFSDV